MLLKWAYCDHCGDWFEFPQPVILPDGSMFAASCAECSKHKEAFASGDDYDPYAKSEWP